MFGVYFVKPCCLGFPAARKIDTKSPGLREFTNNVIDSWNSSVNQYLTTILPEIISRSNPPGCVREWQQTGYFHPSGKPSHNPVLQLQPDKHR